MEDETLWQAFGDPHRLSWDPRASFGLVRGNCYEVFHRARW